MRLASTGGSRKNILMTSEQVESAAASGIPFTLLAFCLALSFLAASCAHTRPSKPSEAKVTLRVADYREGDRSVLLEVDNGTDKLLLYDGPYVETQSGTGWTNYGFEVPEMAALGRAHRAPPAVQIPWWVRLPPGHLVWRAYINCRLVTVQNTNSPAEPFVVRSPEMSN